MYEISRKQDESDPLNIIKDFSFPLQTVSLSFYQTKT